LQCRPSRAHRLFTVQLSRLFLELLTTRTSYHFILFVSKGRAGKAWKPKYSLRILCLSFSSTRTLFLTDSIYLSVCLCSQNTFKKFQQLAYLAVRFSASGSAILIYIYDFSQGYIGIAFQNRPQDSYGHQYFKFKTTDIPSLNIILLAIK